MLRNDDERYGLVAQFFHWAIVALIIVQFVLASSFEDLPLGPRKIGLIADHKSFGMSIFLLAVGRLAWRLAGTTPGLPTTLKPYERGLARLTHWMLYGLIFLIPLSGWLMSSFANAPASWFGLFTWPDLAAPSESGAELMEETHEFLVALLLTVTAVHVLAVLKHVFVYRDSTLARMLPWNRS